jgi:hypothetical protein
MLSECDFQQTVSISMGINYVARLADLFLYSYEADFMQVLLTKKASRSFNFTFRYIDDVLSLNNTTVDDFVDSSYPFELV